MTFSFKYYNTRRPGDFSLFHNDFALGNLFADTIPTLLPKYERIPESTAFVLIFIYNTLPPSLPFQYSDIVFE